MSVKNFRDLIVWQKAMDYVVCIYNLSATFPKTEVYGLASQVRKSAVSVPSNIAEGHGRGTTRDYLHFLSIARGSLYESETQILIADRLGYLQESQKTEAFNLGTEVARLLNGLRQALSAQCP